MDVTLESLRGEIDKLDGQFAALFMKRMEAASKIGELKAAANASTYDPERERKIVARESKGLDDEMAGYMKSFFNNLFDLSRSYQTKGRYLGSQTAAKIREALASAPASFPKSAVVACQGVEGANSTQACEHLFARPDIMYFSSFDAVFAAVDRGMCAYGILPIENSLHGSVTEVYDLMKKYKFYIARSTRVKIGSVLLAKPGVKLSQIREVYSHEQALAQCSEFLAGLKGARAVPYANTAAAAQFVASSEREDIAAIADKNCAGLYNLSVLADDIQNSDNNYTRFICISKNMEIFPGANKISLMFAIPHRPGSLYGIISQFAALGVNLTKLESRPIPGEDFEFMFYADIDAEVRSEEVLNLICRLGAGPEAFTFLGNYLEI